MRRALSYLGATIVILVLWWALAAVLSSPALPTPVEALFELGRYLDQIVPQFAISLERILLSMLIGSVLGVPIGLLIGRSKRADAVVAPLLYVLYPIPKIVFLPVLFVFFGLGGDAKVILISIAIFFQMVVTMRDAAKEVPESAIFALRSLGANRRQVFFECVLPASLPALFTALRITTGTAVAILFIAESMAGSTGLGYFIMHSWSMLEYARMFAGIIALALMGVVLYEAFDVIEKHLRKDRRCLRSA